MGHGVGKICAHFSHLIGSHILSSSTLTETMRTGWRIQRPWAILTDTGVSSLLFFSSTLAPRASKILQATHTRVMFSMCILTINTHCIAFQQSKHFIFSHQHIHQIQSIMCTSWGNFKIIEHKHKKSFYMVFVNFKAFPPSGVVDLCQDKGRLQYVQQVWINVIKEFGNDVKDARFFHAILSNVLSCVTILNQKLGGRNSSLVVCWARCPVWCSIVGSILLWGEFFW